jgi:hypothetical protein
VDLDGRTQRGRVFLSPSAIISIAREIEFDERIERGILTLIGAQPENVGNIA